MINNIYDQLTQLCEGIKQVKQRYVDTDKVPPEIFEEFVNADRSKTKKYVEWMCREYQEFSERKDHIMDVMKIFNQMVMRNKIQGDQKDIYKFNMEEADELSSSVSQTKSRGEKKKDIKDKQVEHVYEDDDILIISPLTYEASQLYGKGTKWCTAMLQTDNHWNSYWRNGTKLYYVIRKNVPELQRKKFAVAVSPGSGTKTVYDEKDISMDFKKFTKEVGIEHLMKEKD